MAVTDACMVSAPHADEDVPAAAAAQHAAAAAS